MAEVEHLSLKKILQKWSVKLKQGYDHDSWGQVVEATDTYKNLAKTIEAYMNVHSDISNDIKVPLLKISKCLLLRTDCLNSLDGQEQVTLKEIHQLQNVLDDILKEKHVSIPENLDQKAAAFEDRSNESLQQSDPSNPAPNQFSSYNSLRPRLQKLPNETLITFNINKIAMKNPSSYIDPYFVMSCKDAAGVDLCKSQQTPPSTKRDDVYLYYGFDVELQIPIEKMSRGSAVFFEFFHYKQQKRMTSNKCFSFMEMDEFKPGPCVIELYSKPTDFKRKKLSLLTSKPLYLHLNLTLHE